MLKKKIVKGMLSLATAIMLVGSDPVIPMMESVGVVQEVEAASRKLSSTKVSVMTGEKSKITLKGVSSKKKKSVKWKSNSKNLVVSYSKKDTRSATFYARKAGTYKVTATYGKKTYVAVVKASKKGMNVTSRTLNKGQKYTLKLKGVKGKAKWTSSKKSVVTVKAAKNGKGAVITAKRPGSATITATVGEKKLVCVVKVKGTTAVVTPKPNPTTAPKPTESPKPQPTESPKPTEQPEPTPTEPAKPTPTEPAKPTPTEPAKPVVKATGIKLSDTDITLTSKGATKKLVATVEPANATDKEVVWESLDPVYATVSSDGTVTAVKRGYAVIACYLKSNREVYAYCSVVVDYDNSGEEKVLAESISLSREYIKITDELDYGLEYTISPANSDERAVYWVSSNPDVADMGDGGLKGFSNGTAVITCYVEGHESIKASCTVEVDITPTLDFPSEIKLNTSSVTLDKVGDTYNLVPTLYPTNAIIYNKSVSWSSSDSSVVSVDNGTVKALKEGTAVITCSSSGAPSVSASCTVTVTAKDIKDTTDPLYEFDMMSNFDFGTTFKGGDRIGINIVTNAPTDKINVVISNNNIQYNTVIVNGNNYGYTLYARKQGKCTVGIYLDDKLKGSWDVVVTSDDKNWANYESWLNGVLKNIEEANPNWKDLNPIQKVTLLGQYILDNYDYDYNPMSAFHLNGKGNCNASANVLADMATRLGLRADVVTPKAYAINNPSHVVARVWYNNVAYLIEAGYEGQAGNRGTVTCIKASEQK